MTIQTFLSDKEFKQSAINCVAQMVSDYAADFIAEGNVADIGEQTLSYLEQVAEANQLNSHSINVYYQIISEENQSIIDFFEKNGIWLFFTQTPNPCPNRGNDNSPICNTGETP